jgi:hypothetical protein
MSVVIVGVYRHHYAENARRLLESALAAGWPAAWWALEEPHPALAEFTIGQGRDWRIPLMNRALDHLGEPAEWTVLADDDIRFVRGDVVRLRDLCEELGYDLAQPARERGTHISHDITRRARLSRARRTSWIESGPLVVIGPRYRDRILPMPPERKMGWGLEIDWFKLQLEQGAKLGIVDAMPIVHFGEKSYDYREMNREMKAELVEYGRPYWAGMQETLATWRPWQRDPPWAKRASSGLQS